MSTRSFSREPGRRGIVFTALIALGIQLGAFWMVCLLSSNVIQESERQTAAIAARSTALGVELQKLTFGILSADAAATNFLLTGKEDALAPFRKANDAAPGTIGDITRLCEGHIDELERIHRISSLSDTAFDRLSDLRQYAGDGKPKAPETAVAAAHKAVQSLVSAVAAFQESDSRALAQTLKTISHSATISQQNVTDLAGAIAIGGGVLSTIILVAVVLRRERRLSVVHASLEEPLATVETEEPVATAEAMAPLETAPARGTAAAVETVPAVEAAPKPIASHVSSPSLDDAATCASPSLDAQSSPSSSQLSSPPPSPTAEADISQAAVSSLPPLIPIIAPTTREVVELALTQVQAAAKARMVTFRAEIGPAWDFATGVDAVSLESVMAGIFEAVIAEGAPGSPVTLSCTEQPGRIARLQFQFYSKLVASQLPEPLLAKARSLQGTSIRGPEAGVIWLEFPCLASISGLAALQNAAQSTIGIASPA